MSRLADAHRAGLQVPPAFVVTTAAYAQHLSASGLGPAIDGILRGLERTGDGLPVGEAATRIQHMVAAVPVAAPVATVIASRYAELCDRCRRPDVLVAVRSSATGEDGTDVSFAGMFDTYLGVSGAGQVLDAVRACWASAYCARALTYRLEHGVSRRPLRMAVGVAELVDARSSGVAFSAHPVNGKRDRVVIEANWGWGSAVVQGLLSPDRIQVAKDDHRVLRYEVAAKQVISAIDPGTGRVAECPMPEHLRGQPVLADDEIRQVVAAVLAAERHYGHPVDVEWVVGRRRDHGQPVSVVQVRPITGLPDPAPETDWDPVAFAAKYAFGPG
jgi:pyruvate,water dikinase